MFRQIAVLAGAVALVSACSAPTPYQGVGAGSYGYDQTAIESDRYLITFNGNSLTERATVDLFLLYRAAELTVERGFDHFTVIRRETEAQRRTVTTGGDPFRSRFGAQYRYFHPAYGWYGWRDPFWNDVNTREITRYQAQAEIVFGHGPAPDDADAFDARDVITNLGPRITRPETG
jgi:hypothetical protein